MGASRCPAPSAAPSRPRSSPRKCQGGNGDRANSQKQPHERHRSSLARTFHGGRTFRAHGRKSFSGRLMQRTNDDRPHAPTRASCATHRDRRAKDGNPATGRWGSTRRQSGSSCSTSTTWGGRQRTRMSETQTPNRHWGPARRGREGRSCRRSGTRAAARRQRSSTSSLAGGSDHLPGLLILEAVVLGARDLLRHGPAGGSGPAGPRRHRHRRRLVRAPRAARQVRLHADHRAPVRRPVARQLRRPLDRARGAARLSRAHS